MPSYLALLHTNRGYQRFKMIELALTTYSVLFVDNQSLLCKWRFHNCTAYAIFILMIQSVYWIIDQYLSVMQSYFLKNAFPCSLTAFFLLKYFPKSNLCGQALYLWNGLCFGLVFAGMSLSSIQYLVTANIWSRSMSAPWDVSTLHESVSCSPELGWFWQKVAFSNDFECEGLCPLLLMCRTQTWLITLWWYWYIWISDAALCAKSKL